MVYKTALQLFPLGCRQGEDKFCADSFGTDDVDIFIMCLNNFFYDRESKTGTLLVLSTGQVGFVETLKNFVLAVFWNSDAGILDRNKYFSLFLVVSMVISESWWLNLMALSIRL